jgi:kynurenine formamidase
MSVRDQLLRDPRVADAWDEGDNGKWALLKSGWKNAEADTHAFHEQTWGELRAEFRRYCAPCQCADCAPSAGGAQ